nr:HepT-like ribonuclease domain-containing protein [uncultured Parabacteroides sp.]
MIVHHYFDVDADEIFNIYKNDIPILHKVIKRIITDIEDTTKKSGI